MLVPSTYLKTGSNWSEDRTLPSFVCSDFALASYGLICFGLVGWAKCLRYSNALLQTALSGMALLANFWLISGIFLLLHTIRSPVHLHGRRKVIVPYLICPQYPLFIRSEVAAHSLQFCIAMLQRIAYYIRSLSTPTISPFYIIS